MRKRTRSRGNVVGLIGALLLFCLGIIVFLVVPVVGWVVGPVVCLLSLFCGGKRETVMVCPVCRYGYARH